MASAVHLVAATSSQSCSSPAASASPSGTRMQQLPYHLLREGSRLLHQQCWVWGQDIKCPSGNLLLDYGFQRQRPPEGISGSSQYTLTVPGELYVRLWGFGVYYGGDVGIFLNRYSFVPRRTSLSDCWQAGNMQGLPRAKDLCLMPGLLRWIAAYEEWIKKRTSAQYRLRRAASFKSRKTAGQHSPAAWLHMADRVEGLLDDVSDASVLAASLNNYSLRRALIENIRDQTHDHLEALV